MKELYSKLESDIAGLDQPKIHIEPFYTPEDNEGRVNYTISDEEHQVDSAQFVTMLEKEEFEKSYNKLISDLEKQGVEINNYNYFYRDFKRNR